MEKEIAYQLYYRLSKLQRGCSKGKAIVYELYYRLSKLQRGCSKGK